MSLCYPSSNTVYCRGTSNHPADIDWYVIQLPRKATLRLEVGADTRRIDPTIEIRGLPGGTSQTDDYERGQAETIVLSDLPPGKYAVQNEVNAQSEAVAGEYKLYVEYITQPIDPSKPDDKDNEAIAINPSAEYISLAYADNKKGRFFKK